MFATFDAGSVTVEGDGNGFNAVSDANIEMEGGSVTVTGDSVNLTGAGDGSISSGGAIDIDGESATLSYVRVATR